MITQDRPPRSETELRENWPDWARDLDDLERSDQCKWSDEERRRWRASGYVGAIVVNAILLAIAHNLLDWQVPFITPAWADVLWAIDLSLGASIIANAVFVGYDARWFRQLVQIGLTGVSLIAWLAVVEVFPFDFGASYYNDVAHLVGSVVVFALIIAIVVQVIAWIVSLARSALN
jgi:hypothetical protein